jgi:hypothetical protein
LLGQQLAPAFPHRLGAAVALTSFQFWTQFERVDLAPAELTRLKLSILEHALKAVRSAPVPSRLELAGVASIRFMAVRAERSAIQSDDVTC